MWCSEEDNKYTKAHSLGSTKSIAQIVHLKTTKERESSKSSPQKEEYSLILSFFFFLNDKSTKAWSGNSQQL